MIAVTRRMLLGVAIGVALAGAVPGTAEAAGKVRIAFGDIPSVESLHFLIAVERAKEKGLEVEVSYLKSEDVAAQAVVSGQADIGVGAPYAMLQKVRAPVRLFYQMSTLKFYPVVNTEFYKSWKDLNGQDIAVHSRGSGTEAIMKLMADREKIAYKSISYVPGSEVRAGAMLQGNIKATVVDSTNRRLLMEKAPGKFAVLPMGDVNATDEALFANTNFLQSRADDVAILVEALLTTWREISENPAVVGELRTKYRILPDMPKDLEKDIGPYFQETVASKSLPLNGGGTAAARDDIAFFTLAGQLQGDPASLKTEDFWDTRPLDKALAKLGTR